MFQQLFKHRTEVINFDKRPDVAFEGITKIIAGFFKRVSGNSNWQVFRHGVPHMVFLPKPTENWYRLGRRLGHGNLRFLRPQSSGSYCDCSRGARSMSSTADMSATANLFSLGTSRV